jgi:hypothetical protein
MTPITLDRPGTPLEIFSSRLPRRLWLAIAAVCIPALWSGLSGVALAEVVSGSPDVTIALNNGTLVATDEDVAVDNQLGIIVLENLGAIPATADVVALGLDANGDRLISFDTTVSLAGGIIARPGDVIRYDGASYTVEFDAAAEGVPSGTMTDATSLAPGGLLLSFDTTIDLSGLVVADEDLVRWDGSTFSMLFDGSSAGLADGLDVDAGQDLGGGSVLMSFDTSGQIAGINFDDEDVLRFDGANWSLEFDASAADSNWAAADLDAVMVPEPAIGALLAMGTLALGFLGRRRS